MNLHLTIRFRRTHRALTIGALIAGALAAAPAAASAANPINCDASALRVSVLGQTALEPVTVNRNQTACKNATGPAGVSLASFGVPLSAAALGAATYASGANDQQKALAVGGVGGLDVGALNTIPGLTLPDLSQYLPAVQTIHIDLTSIPLPPLVTLSTLGLPNSIDVDISGALKALLPSLTNQPLLNIAAATAYAGATCQNGTATPFGTSQVAGVKLLGQDLGTDPTTSGTVSLLDTTSIDLSKIDLTKITLPAVITNLTGPLAPTVLAAVNSALQTAVAGLPKITIPAQVLDVSIKPNQQTLAGGVLTQDALLVDLKLAGQDILNGAIGEARVNTAGVDCSPPAATPAQVTTAAQLQCTKRKLVLTDVLPFGDRVKLQGVADQAYIGQKVAIRFEATKKIVATATVGSDGTFLTTAKMPASKLASTNLARYRAEIGSEKSLDLKLTRRMVVTSQSYSGGKVTIKGYVTKPFAKPTAPIAVEQRVTCTKLKTVGKITPDRTGHFTAVIAAPAGTDTAVYRLATKVRTNEHSKKLFPTFTLPRAVSLT